MTKIKLLDEIIANQIAAGEVVENPASVVKELLENSLDAGATEIDITIEQGGVKLIRIADNGSGMSPEDARLAIKRYATSKITQLQDLEKILSYGFRGEALPSIAAVSRLKIATRESGATTGFELSLQGGHVVSEGAGALSGGTILEVEDLFFNTPARRKFLRSENYEKALITELVTAMALSNPEVTFRLFEGKKELLTLSRAASWIERVGQIFGRDFDGLIPIEEKRGDFHIQGMISKPAFQRANKSRQYFFINGRHVRYPKMSYAAQEAYQEYILHGRYPYLVIFITANPAQVDINVHPQKQQVKVHGEKILQEMLYSIIRANLKSFEGTRQQQQAPFSPPPSRDAFSPNADSGRGLLRENAPTAYATSSDFPGAETQTAFAKTFTTENAPHFSQELALASGEYFGIRQILGQIAETYVVCEDQEGLVLIDQHAAHERIMFEALRRQLKQDAPASQALLFPLTLQLTAIETELLDRLVPVLEKFGFSFSFLGKNTYSITHYPAIFKPELTEAIVQSVLEQHGNDSQRKLFDDELDFVAALMACKAKSVKAGQRLSQVEMLSLIQSLASCEIPGHCCHGRPTLLRISSSELEKRFLRKI